MADSVEEKEARLDDSFFRLIGSHVQSLLLPLRRPASLDTRFVE